MVKNYGDSESGYVVGIVIRVVESYVYFLSSKPAPKIFTIGRFIDGYLMLVARHENLCAISFQSLAKAMPKDYQQCDNNLYTTIDMYLNLWNFEVGLKKK